MPYSVAKAIIEFERLLLSNCKYSWVTRAAVKKAQGPEIIKFLLKSMTSLYFR